MFEKKLKINCYLRNLLIQSEFLYAFTSKWRECKTVDSLKTELNIRSIEEFFWYLTEKQWASTRKMNFWAQCREITAVTIRVINTEIHGFGKIKLRVLNLAARVPTTWPYRVKQSFEAQILTSKTSLNNYLGNT